jgi:hypothetical protein
LAIEVLTVCEWNGPHMDSADILNLTWDQVEDAIRALDEHARNGLYLRPSASNPESRHLVAFLGRHGIIGRIAIARD